MAQRIKKGMHGMTQPRVVDNILGTAIIINRPPFNDIKGEIIAIRNDHMRYLTVQVVSEYPGRVYILNILEEQCKDIKWKEKRLSVAFNRLRI